MLLRNDCKHKVFGATRLCNCAAGSLNLFIVSIFVYLTTVLEFEEFSGGSVKIKDFITNPRFERFSDVLIFH